MAPEAGERGEIALPVALTVGVVPEEERHRRHRSGDHELADLADERASVVVPPLDRRPGAAALDLPGVHGQDGTATHEGGAEIGAAARGEEPQVALHVLVDPVEAL